jgi:hypothetical protein
MKKETHSQIVVFPDTLEFHLKDGDNLKTPWKSTARSDAWALRSEVMARRQANKNVRVKS